MSTIEKLESLEKRLAKLEAAADYRVVAELNGKEIPPKQQATVEPAGAEVTLPDTPAVRCFRNAAADWLWVDLLDEGESYYFAFIGKSYGESMFPTPDEVSESGHAELSPAEARAILVAADWPEALAKFDELCPQKVCRTCDGSGGVDSGGCNPDGRWIDLPCPTCHPQPADPQPQPSEPAAKELPDVSQVQVFGGPAPKTWDDYERGALATYGGGYHDSYQRECFRHGMSTIFNLLRKEFPPAEDCKASAQLTALRNDLAAANAEIERLRKCLKAANDQTEEYERKYYLELNLTETLQAENAALRARLDTSVDKFVE